MKSERCANWSSIYLRGSVSGLSQKFTLWSFLRRCTRYRSTADCVRLVAGMVWEFEEASGPPRIAANQRGRHELEIRTQLQLAINTVSMEEWVQQQPDAKVSIRLILRNIF